jgi:glycosyltransferase involved in cell wall biosynthesis
MEVILLASSMVNCGDHSYRLIEEIGATLLSRNLPYRVFAAKSVEPEIVESMAVVPHFTHNLYYVHSVYNNLGSILTKTSFRWLDRLWGGARALELLAVLLQHLRPGRWPDEQAKYIPLEYYDWKVLNKSHLANLAALPENVWAPDNLIVVTATSPNQLGGLVEFLLGREPDQIPRTVCQLMFPPNWSPSGHPARLGERLYDVAFKRAAPLIGKKLFFTTENEAMANIYRIAFRIEPKILPVPLRVAKLPREKEEKLRLGFFGYSKSDKGFHLLPETAAVCREKGLDIEFFVQIQHSQWEQATIKAERALRTQSNVHLIEGTLSSEDYIAATNKADVVLLPYDPVLFGLRGSGIFTESVAAGRPIIASDGTFAAESIKKGEAQGEVFAPYTAQACAGAIARLLPRLSECNTRAAARAEAFARSHNGEAYVDVLLGFWGR